MGGKGNERTEGDEVKGFTEKIYHEWGGVFGVEIKKKKNIFLGSKTKEGLLFLNDHRKQIFKIRMQMIEFKKKNKSSLYINLFN